MKRTVLILVLSTAALFLQAQIYFNASFTIKTDMPYDLFTGVIQSSDGNVTGRAKFLKGSVSIPVYFKTEFSGNLIFKVVTGEKSETEVPFVKTNTKDKYTFLFKFSYSPKVPVKTVYLSSDGTLSPDGSRALPFLLAETEIPDAVVPVFNPVPGLYSIRQYVTISSATAGASIYYTNDGTTPDSLGGTLFNGPILIETPITLKAVVIKKGYNDSPETEAVYNFNYGTVSTPEFSIGSGLYFFPQIVSITTTTPGASLLYTKEGTTNEYTAPISIPESTSISAIGKKYLYTDSETVTKTYTIIKPGRPNFTTGHEDTIYIYFLDDQLNITLLSKNDGKLTYYNGKIQCFAGIESFSTDHIEPADTAMQVDNTLIHFNTITDSHLDRIIFVPKTGKIKFTLQFPVSFVPISQIKLGPDKINPPTNPFIVTY